MCPITQIITALIKVTFHSEFLGHGWLLNRLSVRGPQHLVKSSDDRDKSFQTKMLISQHFSYNYVKKHKFK